MHKIPRDIHLDFLVGKELSSITVCRYQISFNFDPKGYIGVESAFEIVDGTKKIYWEQEHPDVHIPIQLFGTKVSRYTVEDERTLAITFENKMLIRIFDNSDQYESLQISDGSNKRYII